MTDRIRLDDLTSNDLDALYDRLAQAEQEANDSVAAATRLTVLVGKRAEKAEKAAKNQRRRADIAETELRVLRAGLRANGADPTQIQNLWAQIRLRNRQWRDEKQRADHAEAANDRIRRLAARIRQGVPWATNFDNLADRILTELDGERRANADCSPSASETEPNNPGLRDRIAAAIGQAIEDDNLDNLTDFSERLTGAVLAALNDRPADDTPGCDCGHAGRGVSWHADDCTWRRSVVDCPGRLTPG
ncbi:hypothetical protein OG235_27855 [Streptomyces sp. NBC_00024]|uniref:hypothetical protein n=1 Tax=Streptomyces sp. NBC_00024 TaxID=2903612 RepID=UPI00324358B2